MSRSIVGWIGNPSCRVNPALGKTSLPLTTWQCEHQNSANGSSDGRYCSKRSPRCSHLSLRQASVVVLCRALPRALVFSLAVAAPVDLIFLLDTPLIPRPVRYFTYTTPFMKQMTPETKPVYSLRSSRFHIYLILRTSRILDSK